MRHSLRLLTLLASLPLLLEGQQSYLQAATAMRPPPPLPPAATFTRNPALRSYGKAMGDSLDAGLFRQFLAAEPYQDQPYQDQNPGRYENGYQGGYRYREGSLEMGADCDLAPNATAERVHVFECDESRSITLHTVAITNFLGQENYPIDISSQMRIFIDLTSKLTRRVDDLTVEVSAFKRAKNWLGCGWVYLPSFALLNSDSICRDNPSCPLAEGRQIFEVPMQPSTVFTRLLKLFHQEKDVYQFEIRLRRVSRPFEDLFCLAVQTRLSI